MSRDLPEYQYDCSEGHELAASHPLERCPVVARGVPCPGTLTRFGRGSGRSHRLEVVAS